MTEESAEQHNEGVSATFNQLSNKFHIGEQGNTSNLKALLSSGSIEDNSLDNPNQGIVPERSDPSNLSNSKKKVAMKQTKGPKSTKSAYSTRTSTPRIAASSPWGVPEDLKLKKARSISGQGLEAVRCAWGKAQEGATLHVLSSAFPESRVGEVGLCMLEESTLPREWGFCLGDIPPIGSSPDGVIAHPPGQFPTLSLLEKEESSPGEESSQEEESSARARSTQRESYVSITASAVQREEDETKSNKSLPGSLLNRSQNPLKSDNGNEGIQINQIEVIEVKNSCPFDYSQHGRGGKRRFIISDRGPRQRLDTLWIPQLQLHMLCTGANSALVASRSATRGVRLFRMQADPELQRLMLCVLRTLWVEHVKRRKIPPKDAFANMPEHQAMVKKIRQVAAAAVVVGEVNGEVAAAALAGTDLRFFLD